MTTYTAILSAETDPGSPVKSDLMKRFSDNPIAMFEGASGAPMNRAAWHFYDSTAVGGGTGIIYSFAVSGAVASFETPAFADGYEYLIVADSLTKNSISATSSIELFRETSAAYATSSVLVSGSGTTSGVGQLIINTPRKTLRVHTVQGYFNDVTTNNTVAITWPINTAVIHTTAQKIGKARISVNSSTFSGGTVYMYRRRVDY